MKISGLVISPFQKFVRIESSGGILLFAATIIALIMANSPLSSFYESLWQYEFGFQTPALKMTKPLLLWINDGLMAIFFFVIGLEIKREMTIGDLNNFRKASFPVFAAFGGMIIPVSLYIIFNKDPETSNGWGIPAATDIAFSLAILQVLGKRVPVSLKVFLAAFAIVDDVGAVILIALVYSTGIKWSLLLIALCIVALLVFLAHRNMYSKFIFFLAGVVVWLLFMKGGFHPTVAGVLMAFTIPLHNKIDIETYTSSLCDLADDIRDAGIGKKGILSRAQVDFIDDLDDWTTKVQSPLQHLEHRLHNWVAFFIIPIFAFANAGVSIGGGTELDYRLVVTIMISLIVGKSLGITLFTYLGTKLKLTIMPKDITPARLLGIAFLAGVGFTMSIFIANLAFLGNPDIISSAKTGIILGSFISGLTGYLILRFSTSKSGV